MYTATATWPDIAFAVLALTQFTQKPTRPYYEATVRVTLQQSHSIQELHSIERGSQLDIDTQVH